MAFGFNGASVRRGVASAAASQGLYITLFLGTIMFVPAALISGQMFQLSRITGHDYGIMALAGIVHILIGRYCNYRAVAAMGANRTQPIVGTSTLWSVLIAVVFLNEFLTPLMIAGIALVMVGPALVARPSAQVRSPARRAAAARSTTTVWNAATHPRLLEGYVFGILSAAFWGAGPVLMRAGVEATGLGIIGGLVSYAAASAVLALTLVLPGQIAGAVSMDRSTRMWFVVAGTSSFVANVFRYMALGVAPVSLVIPLMRTAVVFSLAFNWVVNRQIESYEPRVLAGIGVSLVGATLLVV